MAVLEIENTQTAGQRMPISEATFNGHFINLISPDSVSPLVPFPGNRTPPALPAPNGFFREGLRLKPHRPERAAAHEPRFVLPSSEIKHIPEAFYPERFQNCIEAIRDYRILKGRLHEAKGTIRGTYLRLDSDQDTLKRIFEEVHGKKVEGEQRLDVYNITQPITFREETLIGVRVQLQGMNLDSMVLLYEKRGDSFIPKKSIALKSSEDPALTKITNEKGKELLVLSAVRVTADSKGKLEDFRTIFYSTEDLQDWKEIAQGPSEMKDVRIGQFPGQQEVHFFGRPRVIFKGLDYGKGNITYGSVPSLENIHEDAISKAQPIDRKFPPDQWGGVNRMKMLANGLVLAEAHRSLQTGEAKNYYPWAFLWDPKKRKSFEIGIMGESRDGISPQKDQWEFQGRASELRNVMFTGGTDDEYNLWVGRNDLWAQKISSSVIQYHMNNLDYYSQNLLANR